MKLEKQLSDKMMYAIHIDNEKDVVGYFCEYMIYVDKQPKNERDMELRKRTSEAYRDYFIRKGKWQDR